MSFRFLRSAASVCISGYKFYEMTNGGENVEQDVPGEGKGVWNNEQELQPRSEANRKAEETSPEIKYP